MSSSISLYVIVNPHHQSLQNFCFEFIIPAHQSDEELRNNHCLTIPSTKVVLLSLLISLLAFNYIYFLIEFMLFIDVIKVVETNFPICLYFIILG